MKNETFKRASRIETIGVSAILALAQRARVLRAEGRPIIDLSAGQPDFDTPQHVRQAAVAAMDRGETRYTALDGTPELKDAIRRKFSRDNGLEFERDQIIASAGAKQILFNAFLATLEPGDEVVLPTPCWLSYFDIVRICGGEPVAVPCARDTHYKLTPDRLAEVITERTRWLLLNSPSNPTGAVYTADELSGLLEVIAAHPQVSLISDDIYEHLRFMDAPYATPAALRPDLADRILTVNGVSKAYAMTGWRLGYAGGSRALIEAMSVVQSQSTSNPCSLSQAAAVAALDGSQELVHEWCQTFQERRDLIVDVVDRIAGLSCLPPNGAFYLFVSCAEILGSRTPDGTALSTDADLCAFLLSDADLVTVPGSEFGAPGHFRLSFALATDQLAEAGERLKGALAKLTIG